MAKAVITKIGTFTENGDPTGWEFAGENVTAMKVYKGKTTCGGYTKEELIEIFENNMKKGKQNKEAIEKEPETEPDLNNWRLINSEDIFKRLLELKLDFTVRLQLKNIRDSIAPVMRNYEETRIELIKELGESKDEGASFQVKPENKQKFTEELTKLLNQPVDVQIKKIPESVFGDHLSVADVEVLKWMIEEGV